MEFHLGQAGGDGNQLAYGGDQPAEESGNDAVLAEIFFGMCDFLSVEQAKMPHPAVGEFVHDGTAQPFGKEIVDKGTQVGSEGGDYHDHDDVHVAVRPQGQPCGRRYDDFGRERDERAFNHHAEKNRPVIQIVEEEFNHGLCVLLFCFHGALFCRKRFRVPWCKKYKDMQKKDRKALCKGLWGDFRGLGHPGSFAGSGIRVVSSG